ncbi:TipAS antibiotic-recognition domain-containing protein [Paenibacillus sp. PL2-23]|uniref:TipAS antibiotic-recognition domain-containing protein n=1 Tax=Paenibacillus sp. PL2-23 TaxID=2100729 RepID=UPI0030F5EA47
MTNKNKKKAFDFSSSNPFEKEARQRWGDKKVDESNAKVDSMLRKGQLWNFEDELNYLYQRLADMRHEDPKSPKAQAAIGQWYTLLQRVNTYSMEAFKGLGEMYVNDPRFRNNIDEFGEGLAVFMRDAMAHFADNAKS